MHPTAGPTEPATSVPAWEGESGLMHFKEKRDNCRVVSSHFQWTAFIRAVLLLCWKYVHVRILILKLQMQIEMPLLRVKLEWPILAVCAILPLPSHRMALKQILYECVCVCVSKINRTDGSQNQSNEAIERHFIVVTCKIYRFNWVLGQYDYNKHIRGAFTC